MKILHDIVQFVPCNEKLEKVIFLNDSNNFRKQKFQELGL